MNKILKIEVLRNGQKNKYFIDGVTVTEQFCLVSAGVGGPDECDCDACDYITDRHIQRPCGVRYTIYRLENGVRVVNLSSQHSFTFDEGTVVPGVSKEESDKLSLSRTEEAVADNTAWMDVRVVYRPSVEVANRLVMLDEDDDVDVVLCPLPVMEAYRSSPFKKARGVVVGRSEPKVCSSTRFFV